MITIKTDSEIEYMVKAGRVVAEALDTLEKHDKARNKHWRVR